MKIAFLGDSITLGYGLDCKEERFATVLCRKMGAEEINYGITGTLMARAGMNREDGNSFLDRVHLIDGADFAIIFGGTNDYFWSDRPIGNADAGEDYFYSAVNSICKKSLELLDAEKILLVTPYRHNGIGNFRGGKHHEDSNRHDTDRINYNGHCLADYVEVIEKIGRSYKIPVLNLHEKEGFNWKIHTMDGCHPNAEGHRWLAEQIKNSL